VFRNWFYYESTCTVNDGPKAPWVLEGEQPILKKGTGHGSHCSDVICSTFGWLKQEATKKEILDGMPQKSIFHV
jgi:hypothetical protein